MRSAPSQSTSQTLPSVKTNPVTYLLLLNPHPQPLKSEKPRLLQHSIIHAIIMPLRFSVEDGEDVVAKVAKRVLEDVGVGVYEEGFFGLRAVPALLGG